MMVEATRPPGWACMYKHLGILYVQGRSTIVSIIFNEVCVVIGIVGIDDFAAVNVDKYASASFALRHTIATCTKVQNLSVLSASH